MYVLVCLEGVCGPVLIVFFGQSFKLGINMPYFNILNSHIEFVQVAKKPYEVGGSYRSNLAKTFLVGTQQSPVNPQGQKNKHLPNGSTKHTVGL